MTTYRITMLSSRSETGTILVTSNNEPNEAALTSWGEELIHEPFGSHYPPPSADALSVWVHAAVTGEAQQRVTRQIQEWAVEPTVASRDVVLSFLMPDGSAQSLLLSSLDLSDLAIALQRAAKSAPPELN